MASSGMARARIPGVDYASPGCYFITAVTAGRLPLLGQLHNAALVPTRIGGAVESAWRAIPTFRPWITVGPFTLMPDHVHGMLWWHRVPDDREGVLAVVVRGFKSDATLRARAAGILGPRQRLWQRSYDVRFIMSRRRFDIVHRYILDNPRRAWTKLQPRC
jgi:hypothetical protein